MLAALGGLVHAQHRRRGRHRVDDPDDRLLRHGRPERPARREKRGATERERERVPVRGLAADRVPGEERERDAERRHLRERQVHEDDAAREYVEPEVCVDAREDEARQEGDREDVEHRACYRAPSACASRPTFTSKRAR